MKYKNFIKLLKIALKYKVRLFIAVITMIISSIIRSTIPVSYTHRDVYKRQI